MSEMFTMTGLSVKVQAPISWNDTDVGKLDDALAARETELIQKIESAMKTALKEACLKCGLKCDELVVTVE